MRHRFLPIAGIRISPSSDNAGRTSLRRSQNRGKSTEIPIENTYLNVLFRFALFRLLELVMGSF